MTLHLFPKVCRIGSLIYPTQKWPWFGSMQGMNQIAALFNPNIVRENSLGADRSSRNSHKPKLVWSRSI